MHPVSITPLKPLKINNSIEQIKKKTQQDSDMCRPDIGQFGSPRPDPSRILSTKAFYLKLKLSDSGCINGGYYGDPLTLIYLPRISGAPLEVNGAMIRPDSAAYVTLHRAVNAGEAGSTGVVYGSVERVRVGEGVRFEVYTGEERLLKGVFRRDKGKCCSGDGAGWRVECTCVVDGESAGVAEAEVCVAVEGGRVRERVAMRRRRRRRGGGFKGLLEEIPEEEEEEREWDGGWSGCWCDGGSEESAEGEGEEAEWEMEEGVRWAVDVGIWAVCIGVGYLVSRASARTLRRRKILL